MFYHPFSISRILVTTFAYLSITTSDVLGLADLEFHPQTPIKITLDYRLPKSKVYLPTCLNAAKSIHPGQITALGFGTIEDHPYYYFDIKSADQLRWGVACDATTGKIISNERECLPGACGS